MRIGIPRIDVVFENRMFVYFLKDGKVFRGSTGNSGHTSTLRGLKVLIKKTGIIKIESLSLQNIMDLPRVRALFKAGVRIVYYPGYKKYKKVVEAKP